mgnify:CR=1 FL=1
MGAGIAAHPRHGRQEPDSGRTGRGSPSRIAWPLPTAILWPRRAFSARRDVVQRTPSFIRALADVASVTGGNRDNPRNAPSCVSLASQVSPCALRHVLSRVGMVTLSGTLCEITSSDMPGITTANRQVPLSKGASNAVASRPGSGGPKPRSGAQRDGQGPVRGASPMRTTSFPLAGSVA